MKKINFSGNLKKYREAKGLSKEELGSRLGVSGVTVGYWEAGRNEPRMGKVEQIAEVLDVTTDDLLFEDYFTPEVINVSNDQQLSEEQKKAIELILSLPEEEVKMFSLLMKRSINDQ